MEEQINKTSCPQEGLALSYLSETLSNDEIAKCEAHFAECDICRQTIAEFTKLINEDPTSLSADLTNVCHETADKAWHMSPSISTSPSTSTSSSRSTLAVVPNNQQDNHQAALPKAPVSRLFLIAASIGIFFLLGLIAIFIWNTQKSVDLQLARSFTLLEESTKDKRPIEFRISQLSYSHFSNDRGGADEENNRLTEAHELALSAVKSNETAESLQMVGRVLLAEGKYKQAIDYLSKAEKLEPNNADIISDLGIAKFLNGAEAEALQYFDRALSISANHPTALFNRALYYQNVKQYDKAKEAWNRYLTIDASSQWAQDAQHYLSPLK